MGPPPQGPTEGTTDPPRHQLTQYRLPGRGRYWVNWCGNGPSPPPLDIVVAAALAMGLLQPVGALFAT